MCMTPSMGAGDRPRYSDCPDFGLGVVENETLRVAIRAAIFQPLLLSRSWHSDVGVSMIMSLVVV